VVADEIERRNTAIVACHRFPVDDAGPRAQPGERLDDQREAVGQVIARPAVELHARAIRV